MILKPNKDRVLNTFMEQLGVAAEIQAAQRTADRGAKQTGLPHSQQDGVPVLLVPRYMFN